MHKKTQFFTGIAVLLITLVTSYLVHTHPRLNLASLFNATVTGDDTQLIYIPNYDASMGEEGVIEVKSKDVLQPFDSMSFVLKYNPTDALTFDSNALVMDNQTLFQNLNTQKVQLKAPGELEVTLVSQAPLDTSGIVKGDVSTHKTLFKLRTTLSNSIPEGQSIQLQLSDFAISNGNQALVIPSPAAAYIKAKAAVPADDIQSVSITSVSPQSISSAAATDVTLMGEHLSIVKKVLVGQKEAMILNQSDTSITLKVPAGLVVGPQDIVIADESDNSVSFSSLLTVSQAPLQEEVAPGSPQIKLDRSYTSPASATNDGTTPLTLYVFVEDDNLKSVVANLTNIGQVGPENGGILGEKKNENLSNVTCPTNSTVIVCMKPSIQEGNGQWFILTEVTVSKAVQNSETPYQVPVLAIDQEGHSDTEMLPVYVGSEANAVALKPLAAVSTSATTVEVLFNKSVDPVSVPGTGEGFSITSTAQNSLAVSQASLDASGKVLTLTTASQSSAEQYALTVSSLLKDVSGKSVDPLGSIGFDGFKALSKAPILDYLTTMDTNTVELEFQDSLKLSTVLAMKLSVYEADAADQKLEIKAVKLLSNKMIQIQTSDQTVSRKYRVTIEGLQSYDGTNLPVPLNKGFKGYNEPSMHGAATHLADLNNDNTVDFADFTIFSSVYGKTY